MTLLLGPPGSGKTTLLLALSGLLGSELKVSGKVTYNGHEMHEFVPQRSSAYVSQHDVHIGEMTVRETLGFSAACQGVGPIYEMLLELLRREKQENIEPDPFIDALMKAFVLDRQRDHMATEYTLKICADTIIGDQMTRGISGGQKKRVTIGEMLVGPATALFMDSISVGLDSSTTYHIINSIRQSVQILNRTALISLLQPPPETFELFDDIILLSEGHMVCQGPRFYVLQFFEYMGFRCPDRKAVADFLQEVISRKDQAQYWARGEETYTHVSTRQFAEEFRAFHVGRAIQNELAIPFDKSMSHPFALTRSKFGTKKINLLKASLKREFLLMKRNLIVFAFKIIQLTVLGLITASAFSEDRKHHDTIQDGTIHMGALFIGLVTLILSGFAVLPMTISKLPVYYKQRSFRFYPSWAYSFPTLIPGMLFSLVEVSFWVISTYFIIGFDPNFIRQVSHYISRDFQINFMRGRKVTRNVSVASVVANLAVMWLVIFSGFVLSRDVMKKWLVWAYWTSPLMYVYNAIVGNEFLGRSWANHHAPGSNETLGIMILKSHGTITNPHQYWVGILALVGFTLLFALFANLALAYLKPYGAHHSSTIAVLDEEKLNAGELNQKKPQNHQNITLTKDESRGAVKGTSIPFTPLCITFENIVYSVDMPKERRDRGNPHDRLVLLNEVSGAFRPGVLTALMGVTGAGKTTLLDVLAGRKNTGCIEGSVKISGYPKKQETFARVSGYCEQNDIHSPLVTVYESIVFSASLRLPKDVGSQAKQNFVDEIMELIELTPIKDALVGLPNVNGLSVEQRKRLTISVELVANPSILFMDEPTSGLDARAAAIVMRVVRNTVNTGRTVVCTIHQPSIDIFESFDELFLLKQGGQVLYAGPLGHHCCHLIDYFEIKSLLITILPLKSNFPMFTCVKQINGVPKIRDGYNPATWVLEVTTRAQEELLRVDFADIYLNSDLYRRNKALIRELSIPPPNSQDLHFPSAYPQSYLTQWRMCLWRHYKSYWRDIAHNGVRYAITLASAFMFGIVFWKIGSKREKQLDIIGGIGSMYISTMFIGAQTSGGVMPAMAKERPSFYRERSSGLYAAIPYALAQVVIEIPYVLAQVTIFEIIAYAMIGFEWTASKFLEHYLFTLLSLLCFTYYGMMIVSVTPNQETCSILSSLIYSMWNLFAGFAIPRTNGMSEEAVQMFYHMKVEGVEPTGVTLFSLLLASANLKVVKEGLAQNGLSSKAMLLSQQMQEVGIKPNAKSLTSLLSVCIDMTSLKLGKAIHGYITRRYYSLSTEIATSLVDMYGSIDEAWKGYCVRQRASIMQRSDLYLWIAQSSSRSFGII
ncbi:hypothetical protein Cgig2_018608 [Carnegiea gigantea]|uniref:ABC transporter domain-containing protein n=1 Tax=Carnegiea gigantea TaxID=171969 RepID=A0A9Q1KGJ6_9CARY|nr:hypothetical protein Cgig2_018608 [Carnegiea gigantea]